MLRDSLGSLYRSSSKAKKRRRIENSYKVSNNIEHIINSLPKVSLIMSRLVQEIQTRTVLGDDDAALLRFTEANCQLLDAFKSQQGLAQRFQEAISPDSDDETSSSVEEDSTPMVE